MSAPLEGILVLDLSLGLFGPYCGMMLADMGAEVIKIERADVGEGMRYSYLSHIQPGMGVSWAGVNRGKKSLALDIRPAAGRQVFLKLVERCDVVIQNFRPGVMERLGFGYPGLSAMNPRLIMASLSGYGVTGPHAQKTGQDLLTQAYAGTIALQGYENDEPVSVGTPIADGIAAVTAAWGVALALYVREKTGVGQEITSNLADALLALSPMDWADYLHSGELRKSGRGWYPNMPYGPWQARDRAIVVMFQNDVGWIEFCLGIGMPELEHDPRFTTNLDRVNNRVTLEEVLKPVFRSRDAAEWQQMLEAMGVRCDLVNDYRDLEQDPQTAINQMIVEQEHPSYGKIRTVGQALKLSKTPGAAYDPGHLPPPLYAEHTSAILSALGYDDAQIAEMDADGVVNTKGLPPGISIDEAMAIISSRARAQ